MFYIFGLSAAVTKKGKKENKKRSTNMIVDQRILTDCIKWI